MQTIEGWGLLFEHVLRQSNNSFRQAVNDNACFADCYSYYTAGRLFCCSLHELERKGSRV
jgi:hypothetical protein